MPQPPHTSTDVESRRRQTLELLERLDGDGLLVAAVPQVGEHLGAGWLGYLFGYRLDQRFAYGVLSRSGEARLILPPGLRWSHDDEPAVPLVELDADRLPQQILEALTFEGRTRARLAVLGLRRMLPANDYAAMRAAGLELIDAEDAFATLRIRKSAAEHQAIASARAIAARGAAVLRESFAATSSVRELTAELTAELVRAGATATHLLVAVGRRGRSSPHFSIAQTVNAALRPTDSVTFAIEVAGPEGYWAELAETLGGECLDESSRHALEIATAASERFARLATPGTAIAAAFGAVVELVAAEGLELGHSLGHGIGRDLVEEPGLGSSGESVFQEGMTFALHPHLVGGEKAAYIADTYVVQSDGAVPSARNADADPATREPSWTAR
jgi:Xaa-Pro aminopeptidase